MRDAMATGLSRPYPWSRNREFRGINSSPCRTFVIRTFERSGFCPRSRRLPGHSSLSVMRASQPHASFTGNRKERLHVLPPCQDQALCCKAIGRRAASALLFLTNFEPLKHCNTALAADEKVKLPLILESYVDEREGFTLLIPTQWSKIEKAGATALFEDPQSKGNNVGVVVNPVRISSLSEFGTVDIVADKLLQAEKKKPSTNDVQLIKVNERLAHGGAPLYQLEYKLDSSRGVKRILSAVTVASKKLYILNVAYADTMEKPLQPDTASILEKIVNSFDVL
ncbi:hypothetical protein GOP47_0014048 [Adiantum capillus-veneris]|uniref:PsbP C-terminal domain-containing protein n=1 Tax=Adiantum capillus-veneris TaxID=13818 RepID=A0A9D4ZF53_ADICA|nr:hypothetical protein GOP47_0014048 [Adiantum capillus-veneris]